MKEIILNKEDGITQAILLEDGKIVEQYDDSKDEGAVEGNIYCGIVQNVLQGMQAAFVNIGEDKNAFMHIKDVIPKVSNQTGNKAEDLSKYNIKRYLKQNTPELVQVKKDEENKKGARVSKHISITGRLGVLMVDVSFITISQKIEEKEEITRLKNIAKAILSNYKENKYGLILRTAAKGKTKEEIEKDVEESIKLWEQVEKKYSEVSKENKPQLIYRNYDVISKFLTSVLEDNIEKITVNTESLYKSINSYLEEINKKIEVKLVPQSDINKYGWKEQLEKASQRKVWLKCGGFIAIDKTEALTAIDVNSGKFTGRKTYTKDETIFKVNKEATVEIAKQLRLRNISGIIVIDYIDMQNDAERQEILQMLEKELKKDRSKTQVIGFTKLDLLEVTRKKL